MVKIFNICRSYICKNEEQGVAVMESNYITRHILYLLYKYLRSHAFTFFANRREQRLSPVLCVCGDKLQNMSALQSPPRDRCNK